MTIVDDYRAFATHLAETRDGLDRNEGRGLLHLCDRIERMEADHRAALVRIVVARDWAVMVSVVARCHEMAVNTFAASMPSEDELSERASYEADMPRDGRRLRWALASLPCAADVVDAFIKEQENR